ncbi:4'-phosphopantetheinyl transferase family protein [Streptomyces sp. NPDC056144]|uniref:4'-phosphopantetheinyl transferase family protein n=1 Tax=unclassified Streptomyces TaxID=2593676 RepID=UPI0035DC0ADE
MSGAEARTVTAAVATTAEVLDHPELHEGLLAPWELRRLDAIRVPARRADVVAARLLLRLCVARCTGRPPGEAAPAQHCPGCGRYGHGRPYLPDRPDLGISLSHADGLVAAAVGPGAVGIDVEPAARRPGPPSTLGRMLPEAAVREAAAAPDPEAALLRLWVRGEALFKAGQARIDEAGESGLTTLEWTDRSRAAVVALAGPAPLRALSVFPAVSVFPDLSVFPALSVLRVPEGQSAIQSPPSEPSREIRTMTAKTEAKASPGVANSMTTPAAR